MMAVLLFCVCAWGAVSIVGGFGAPPSRLATVESGGGGGGNEPTDDGDVPVKAVPPAKGRGSARHSNAGPNEASLGSSLFALSLSLSL